MQGAIPEEVKQLIYRHISSVMQLEVLLYLLSHAQQAWSIASLAREFRVDPGWVEAELDDLCRGGLLLCAGDAAARTYRYVASTPEIDHAVQGLAKAYADRRVTVTSLIYAKPVDNIRVFADAFKLKKG